MGLVDLPTFTINLCQIEVNIPVPWILLGKQNGGSWTNLQKNGCSWTSGIYVSNNSKESTILQMVDFLD